jgi:hypothetical protein
MADHVVTVIRCGTCRREGTLKAEGDRFWCSWCGDWASVELLPVRNAVVAEGAVPSLVAAPPPSTLLQPLRVPTGWGVEYNNGLYEVDPSAQVAEADRCWLFKQDMLLMRHERRNRLLDVGWYPDGDLQEGEYRLVVHEGDFRGPRLHEFATRDRLALVAEIERLLRAVTDARL